MNFQDLYNERYFINSKNFQNNVLRINEMAEIVKSYNPTKVLDVGCGWGALVRKLRADGIDAYGIDAAETLKQKFWKPEETFFSLGDIQDLPFGDKLFTVVISSDFFEHIPEEDIDKVVSEMKRVGKIVLARVAYEDKLNARQAQYHVTNKPREWWDKKLLGVKQI